jgi:hypothetical protein
LSFDGDGSSRGLISSDPPSFISYSSDILDVENFASRDFAFSITGASPGFTTTRSGFGAPFAASLSGGFSGAGVGAVPEPASRAMLIVGFGLTGAMARRRNRTLVAIKA